MQLQVALDRPSLEAARAFSASLEPYRK